MDDFYLGADSSTWLGQTSVPLIVSRRRMRVRTPRAIGPWVLDSGGFTELTMHGRWTLDASSYAAMVTAWHREVGGLRWAAPQDWMCEPAILSRTGLGIPDHQRLTVRNFLELREMLGLLVIPVLQGFEHDDYLRCADLYAAEGVDLAAEPTVGLGSVCRRQDTEPAARIASAFRGLRLHGFGVKLTGLRRFAHVLASADSMAWSYRARRGGPLPGHTHDCTHCIGFALTWRERALAALSGPQQTRLVI